jgi:two-component sensor histidine kinase
LLETTERRRAHEQQQLLIAEIKHRIKDTLATVQSIAVQTLRSTSAEERQAFVGRLRALAGAHDLVALESWNRASVHDVVRRALKAFQEDHRERFLISGPRDVWLNASKLLLLAMALYGLGTNAVEYAHCQMAVDRCVLSGNCCKVSNSIGQNSVGAKEAG